MCCVKFLNACYDLCTYVFRNTFYLHSMKFNQCCLSLIFRWGIEPGELPFPLVCNQKCKRMIWINASWNGQGNVNAITCTAEQYCLHAHAAVMVVALCSIVIGVESAAPIYLYWNWIKPNLQSLELHWYL